MVVSDAAAVAVIGIVAVLVAAFVIAVRRRGDRRRFYRDVITPEELHEMHDEQEREEDGDGREP